MSSQPARRRRLEVEDIGDVAVVNFVDKKILDEQTIQMIRDDLFRLVDESGKRKLVLNLANVEFTNSATWGPLVSLHRKMQALQGKLVLCKVASDILDQLRIIKLDRILTIVASEPDALEWLSESRRPDIKACCPIRGCLGKVLVTEEMRVTGEGRCPECRADIRYEGHVSPARCRVRSVALPTYRNESIVLVAGSQKSEAKLVGRLDLFAAEQLEKLWASLPEPRRVLLDMSQATELSRGGAGVLNKLAQAAQALAVLLQTGGQPIDTVHLPAGVPHFTDRDAAEVAVSEGAPLPPLMVDVSFCK